jgi:VIT1/CCC1 family predicted Fe2+/Mn2+ transporter
MAGIMPLLDYLLPVADPIRFPRAVALALATLFAVGAGRAGFMQRHWLVAGLGMLGIGAVAAAAAYVVGMFGAALTPH